MHRQTNHQQQRPLQTHSGFMMQGVLGVRGNFEMVVPGDRGGLLHFSRNNDASGCPWAGPESFGHGNVAGVSLIQSNFGERQGNLEMVCREGDRLAFYWREDVEPYRWHGPEYIAHGVCGNPALIQGRFGQRGNFELVVPLLSGGIAHFCRENDSPGVPWKGPVAVFGTELGRVEAVAMIQSNYNTPGNLEVVARIGSRLLHFWRDSGPGFHWHGPKGFYNEARGIPSFIQSNLGRAGNFELVTPHRYGGLVHMYRDNDGPMRWGLSSHYGGGQLFDAASVIQSNFGTPGRGNLEVMGLSGSQVQHFYRIDTEPWAWFGPSATLSTEIGSSAAGGTNFMRVPPESVVAEMRNYGF